MSLVYSLFHYKPAFSEVLSSEPPLVVSATACLCALKRMSPDNCALDVYYWVRESNWLLVSQRVNSRLAGVRKSKSFSTDVILPRAIGEIWVGQKNWPSFQYRLELKEHHKFQVSQDPHVLGSKIQKIYLTSSMHILRYRSSFFPRTLNNCNLINWESPQKSDFWKYSNSELCIGYSITCISKHLVNRP
jgi:hypothetical protein